VGKIARNRDPAHGGGADLGRELPRCEARAEHRDAGREALDAPAAAGDLEVHLRRAAPVGAVVGVRRRPARGAPHREALRGAGHGLVADRRDGAQRVAAALERQDGLGALADRRRAREPLPLAAGLALMRTGAPFPTPGSETARANG
jgi:hypothetical protein